MKNINFLFLAFIFISILSMNGQSAYEAPVTNTLKIGNLKVKKIDFSLGFESDYIRGMDADFFIEQMPEAQQARLSDLNFHPDYFDSGVCENPSINLGFTLVHPNFKNMEWRSALAYKPNRVDAISYSNHSEYEGNYITINGTHSEYTIESALIYRLPVLSFFNLYGGFGTNLGLTSPNETCVFTSMDLTATDISYSNVQEVNEGVPAGRYGSGDGYSDCFDTGMQMNQRVFAQVGTGIIFFQRIEIGFDIKYGIGYRADFGSSINGTHIVATNLNLRYILR